MILSYKTKYGTSVVNYLNKQHNQDYKDLQLLKYEKSFGGHKLRDPESVNFYNYKIVKKGDQVEVKYYDEPIFVGYQRKHTPQRRENRTMANEQNVKRARRNVHDLVNTNWTEYTKMLTLTYKETMLDYDQLAMDWKVFRKGLKRKGYNPPYLAITEHQKKRGEKEGNKGSLHMHVLLFTDDFIPFDTLKDCWTKGSVDIRHIPTDNKGKYVAKYINKETMPADKKAYRTSRKIKRPTVKVGFENGRTESELAVANVLGSGHKLVDTHNYSLIRSINQETGEITKESEVKIERYTQL